MITITYDDRWQEEPEIVDIAALTLDDELFPRERLDPETVDEYAEQTQAEGVRFPPIRVIKLQSGSLMLVDGWHRVEAARRLGDPKIRARVRPGEWLDAVEAAAASNARHGRPRTNADKRRAVGMLLALPTWAKKSDRQIASHCMVGHHLVAEVRASMTGGFSPSSDNPLKDTRTGSRGPSSFSGTRPAAGRGWQSPRRLAAGRGGGAGATAIRSRQ